VATLQTEALVLRSLDFGESDRIVHLLAPRAGRLTAIAKGARRSVRRFPGTLDLFNQLRIQVVRRKPGAMARLEQATLIHPFASLRSDPARFALGCFLLELLDRLAPEGAAGGDARRLFEFALGSLQAVAASPVDRRLRILLPLRALDALGLRPELGRCVRCGALVGARPAASPGSGRDGAPDRVSFHVAEGGALCSRCSLRGDGALPVALGTLRALEQGLSLPLPHLDRLRLSPRALEEAGRLLRRFQRFHLGIELRSERVLDQMIA
jgi:DNA repair protein RecO (recombination protein O)